MKFDEYFERICELCIVNVGEMWSSYLEPTYKVLLERENLLPEIVEDATVSIYDVGEMLKLEVERRHAVTGKSRVLTNWIYEIIDGTIEPSMEVGEQELMNKIIDLLQKNKEEKQDKKLPDGINFSKKEDKKVSN